MKTRIDPQQLANQQNQIPDFVKGVLATLNCLHWKLPFMGVVQKEAVTSFLCGYGADVTTGSGFKYAFTWNETSERYEAVAIE